MRAFSRADLSGFVAERYTAGRMILSAAGDVDHAEIVALAEGLFGHLPARDGGTAEPARFAGGETRTDRDLEQVHFTFGLEMPGYRDPGVYTAQIYGTALGGGIVMGFAAALARGCTSGQALSGGAVLSAGSWLFMFSVFGGGYLLAWFVRKNWRTEEV